MALTLDEMREIVSRIRCLDYEFHVLTKGEVPYLQVRYVEPDIVTGDPTDQHGRKWMLSHHMVRSELVQTALKAVLTSMEHRAREHFFFEGQRVGGCNCTRSGRRLARTLTFAHWRATTRSVAATFATRC